MAKGRKKKEPTITISENIKSGETPLISSPEQNSHIIQSIDYKDFLINQPRLPDKESQEYKEFFEFHKELCLNGAMVNGVYFTPFLYWHLNMWNTEVDYIDDRGRIGQKYTHPTLRDNEWIIAEAIEKAHLEKKGLVIGGIRRLAKALQNNELLYTEFGTKPIGEAKIGDRIYDNNGELTTITGVFPQGKIPIYKMTLEDGREILCCENHIWRVKDKRNKGSIKDLTVKQLLPIYKNARKHNGYKDKKTRVVDECHFAIPNSEAVNYPHKDLPIDPYFLGLWLGDGSARRIGITTKDVEISNYVYEYATKWGLQVRVDRDEYIVTSGIMGGTRKYNTLFNTFKELNLIKNKHIPENYLYASIEQRLELLRGLMDSDGSVYTTGGRITFVTTNIHLAQTFYQLCRSLGINTTKKEIIPKLYGKECGRGWRFSLFTEKPIFKLKRKLEKIRIGNKGQQFKINYTSIRNIELVGEDYATCITVSNPDKLFLTTNYTVTHNSVLEASYVGWGATFDENSQNVISGLNAADIKLITDKLDKGLNFLPEYYKWQRIEDNWKNQVTLGIKTKAGERIPYSYILIRNLDEGNNEEAIAGTKPRKLIIDEGGKGPFLRGLKAAMPGFTTPYGWGCSPLVTFTGGDMTKFADAKLLFFDVDAFNFLTYNSNDDTRRVHGLFLGHKYRMEAKEPSTLGDFLGKKDKPLKEIPMLVSSLVKADKITQDNLAKAKKAGDRIAYLKEKMYYPTTVDDIFLNEDTNIFDVEGAKRQKARLLQQGLIGTPVVLFPTETGVGYEFTDKRPITNFPLKPNDDKDAPVVILEFPVPGSIYGLNTAGVDPYRQGKAVYSTSLGSIYIFKRMHDIASEKYQDMFVAYYTARPDDKKKWEKQAELLIKMYNARTLCENDDISFIEHMKSVNAQTYLEKQPEWLKEIVPNSQVKREFGVHRSSDKIRDFLHNGLKRYSEEIIYEEKDEQGNIIKQVTGMSKILDPMLLEEMIQYREDGNFDRIVAAELALAQAYKMAPIYGPAGGDVDDRIKSLYRGKSGDSKKESSSLFTLKRGLFHKKKRNLFI